MATKKAARHRCSSERAQSGRQTASIVSNHEAFALVASSTAFVLVVLAVPTAMALMKCWGVW